MDGLYVLEEISILTNWPNRGKGFDLSAFTRESCLQVKGKKSCGFQGFMKATPNHSATSGSCFFSMLFRKVHLGVEEEVQVLKMTFYLYL